MADASLYGTILDACVTAGQGLGLTFGDPPAAVPWAVRKLPRAEEALDQLPLFCVCPAGRPEGVEPWSSEDEVLVKYPVDVVLVAAGNRDFTASNLDTYFRWREQVRRLFQFGVPGVSQSQVFFADVRPDAPMDRDKLNDDYDYSGLSIAFWAAEPRTN